MSRPSTARIDLDALGHNFQRAQEAAPHSQVIAVVKANGYGHGSVRVARALGEAKIFAVAAIDEALELRAGGIQQPVLLLEGVFEADELALCIRHDFAIVIHHAEQLSMLERASLAQPLAVWLKLDSGMHRLGIDPAEAKSIWRRLQDCPNVGAIRLMSHFASADERDNGYTAEQLHHFQAAIAGIEGEISLANSAAVLAWPDTHADWIRPGLMLYGASPFAASWGGELGLQPVMTLSTRLIAVNSIRRSESIGYGQTWLCPEDMRIGVAAIGYGDGYPREVPNGTPVLLNGREAPLVGRVSMDMITLDLRQHPQAKIGDPVVLWGQDLPIERIAAAAGTIPYTLMCQVTRRVRFEEQNAY